MIFARNSKQNGAAQGTSLFSACVAAAEKGRVQYNAADLDYYGVYVLPHYYSVCTRLNVGE